jgi:hypothetical protein
VERAKGCGAVTLFVDDVVISADPIH